MRERWKGDISTPVAIRTKKHQMSSILTIEFIYDSIRSLGVICWSKRDMVGRVSQVNVTMLSLRSANKIQHGDLLTARFFRENGTDYFDDPKQRVEPLPEDH